MNVQESDVTSKSNFDSVQQSSYVTNTQGQVDINIRTNVRKQINLEQLETPS